jgi:NhaP-type Na+/H+ or K+/H+ antiporter
MRAMLLCRDPTLTTIVTLLSAYSSYYVADRLVGASGLLAVVMNGFTMSLIGEEHAAGVQ